MLTQTALVADALRDDAEIVKTIRPDIATRMRIAAAAFEQVLFAAETNKATIERMTNEQLQVAIADELERSA